MSDTVSINIIPINFLNGSSIPMESYKLQYVDFTDISSQIRIKLTIQKIRKRI